MSRQTVSVARWFSDLPEPTPQNRELERLFLANYTLNGGLAYEETSRALADALKQPSEAAVGHALFLRLFGEYANALEVLGAWGRTIRHRRDTGPVLDAFLAYRHDAPREFFRAVRRNRSGPLILLLKLPPRRTLTVLAQELGRTEVECTQAMEECMAGLGRAADPYFGLDEIVRTTYNKAKHGATIVRTSGLTEREFYVLAPGLGRVGQAGEARYDLSEFRVDRQMIKALEHGVKSATSMMGVLVKIASALLERSFLYPDSRGVRSPT